jgi:hypothetical protein
MRGITSEKGLERANRSGLFAFPCSAGTTKGDLMHLIARGTEPCGLEDGHGGRHRTMAGAARERERQATRTDEKARYDANHPAQAYLRKLRYDRRRQGVAA